MTTMQNWQDNTQARVPGYRDRIVHISQSDDEGGMNLNMAPKVIEDLAGRGRSAAEKLIEEFARQPSGSKDNAWENHRWVRFRSTMALFEQALLQNMTGYQDPPHPTLEDLTQRPAKMPPTSYRPTSSQQQQMVRLMRYLGALAKWWEKHPSFSEGAPKPEAELRITPKI